jgi:hypothetical protein
MKKIYVLILLFAAIGFVQCVGTKSISKPIEKKMDDDDDDDDPPLPTSRELIISSLDTFLMIAGLGPTNVVQIKKINNGFRFAVMGKGYATAEYYNPDAERILEGIAKDSIFRRKVADVSEQLGCIHMYSPDAGLSYYVTKGKCK